MKVVTLQVLKVAAAHRAVSLAGELAGYLVLDLLDAQEKSCCEAGWENVVIADDGRVLLQTSATPSEALSPQAFLGELLTVATAVAQALRKAASEPSEDFRGALSKSLIPLNRAAARRAIARMYRELERAQQNGKIPSHLPPPPRAQEPAALLEPARGGEEPAEHLLEPVREVPSAVVVEAPPPAACDATSSMCELQELDARGGEEASAPALQTCTSSIHLDVVVECSIEESVTVQALPCQTGDGVGIDAASLEIPDLIVPATSVKPKARAVPTTTWWQLATSDLLSTVALSNEARTACSAEIEESVQRCSPLPPSVTTRIFGAEIAAVPPERDSHTAPLTATFAAVEAREPQSTTQVTSPVAPVAAAPAAAIEREVAVVPAPLEAEPRTTTLVMAPVAPIIEVTGDGIVVQALLEPSQDEVLERGCEVSPRDFHEQVPVPVQLAAAVLEPWEISVPLPLVTRRLSAEVAVEFEVEPPSALPDQPLAEESLAEDHEPTEVLELSDASEPTLLDAVVAVNDSEISYVEESFTDPDDASAGVLEELTIAELPFETGIEGAADSELTVMPLGGYELSFLEPGAEPCDSALSGGPAEGSEPALQFGSSIAGRASTEGAERRPSSGMSTSWHPVLGEIARRLPTYYGGVTESGVDADRPQASELAAQLDDGTFWEEPELCRELRGMAGLEVLSEPSALGGRPLDWGRVPDSASRDEALEGTIDLVGGECRVATRA